jgi:MFS superfamily sulfate permease-like transporter
VDRLHEGPRTHYDKELMAQGAGNAVCGMLGSLPMTAVIVRSAANVQAGARTKASRVLHGVWLLVFAAAFPAALGVVPLAALAGVLIHAGCKLIPLKEFGPLWRKHRGEAVVLATTAVAIVATNMFEGVLLGLLMAIAKSAWETSHVHLEIVGLEGAPERTGTENDAAVSPSGTAPAAAAPSGAAPSGATALSATALSAVPGASLTVGSSGAGGASGAAGNGPEADGARRTIRVRAVGHATFLRLPKLLDQLEALPRDREIELDLSGLRHLDHACAAALGSWAEQRRPAAGEEGNGNAAAEASATAEPARFGADGGTGEADPTDGRRRR